MLCVSVSVCVLYINIRKEKRGERKTDERGGGVHPARDEERGLRAALPASQLKMNLDLWI